MLPPAPAIIWTLPCTAYVCNGCATAKEAASSTPQAIAGSRNFVIRVIGRSPVICVLPAETGKRN